MTAIRKKNLFLLLVFSLLIACPSSGQTSTSLDELSMYHVTLISRDIKEMAAWYRKFLKFVVLEYVPDKHVKMRRGEFQIHIQKGQNTLLAREITFKKGKKYVNGIDKIGFDTNQFDSLNLYFERYEQKYYEKPYLEPNLGKKSMIVLDPEGNKLQFFDVPSEAERFTMIPVFFSINCSDYATTRSWYKEKMGFNDLELKDESKAGFQNFFTNGNIILELLHLPLESLETTEFMPIDRDLASYDQIMFRTGLAKKIVHEMDNGGNKIVLKR